jgi:lysyl-tRNA synthetase class 2
MSADRNEPAATLGRIMQERREKAAGLRGDQADPYGNAFRPDATCDEIRRRYGDTRPAEAPADGGIVPVDDRVYRLAGRVMAKRGFGKAVFAPLRDATGDLQLYLAVDHMDPSRFQTVVKRLDAGDIVGAEGKVFWTKRGELSLLASSVDILTKSLRPLPEKWHGLTDVELRYRQRYVDLAVNPDVREVFRKRSQIVAGIRRFLDGRGYIEVETPMMHPIIGGAAARPFITHHNALDMKLYMRIAPELYLKRLVVGGLERVYEINRNFRNEGLSREHNPEFTMLEFYQAYATYEELIPLTEELVVGLAKQVNGTTRATWNGVDIDLAPPWRRLSVRQAVEQLAGISGRVFEDPGEAARKALELGIAPDHVARILAQALAERGGPGRAPGEPAPRADALIAAVAGADLSDLERRVCAGHLGYSIFEHAAEDKLVTPTFLTDFPLAVSPLARKKPSDPSLCDRFELFVGGTEIANGFSELNDPDDQRERFAAQLRAREQGADETMDYDEDYCRALEVGMPPAAGEGVGIDRLTMLLTGQPSIRDVILFPLMRPE